MPAPDISELQSAARSIVRRAKTAGNIESYTPRTIRQEIERQFSLDAGTLDTNEYKRPLKSAITDALEADSDVDNVAVSKSSEGIPLKASKEAKTEPKIKAKAKAPGKKNASSAKEYKSAANVASSDEDNDNGAGTSSTKDKLGSPVLSGRQFSPKKEISEEPAQKKRKNVSDTDDDGTVDLKYEKSEPSTSKHTKEEKSDSEMSILIDEPPKRKKKAKTKDQDTKRKKTAQDKKPRKSTDALSKDEETIKRLKSLVLACGVRKVWSKLFKDIDQPSQQIKKLKEILTELGMSGRMSLEQAKSIKEKRDLAKELEDVQMFEQSVVGRSSRSKVTKSSKAESDSDEQSDENEVPTKRKNARRSIMAFLDDQSDED